MGNCIISIEVTGAHHNGNRDDIDQCAADFVQYLKSKGHTVTHCSLTSGSTIPLGDITRRMPLKADQVSKKLDVTLKTYGGKLE